MILVLCYISVLAVAETGLLLVASFQQPLQQHHQWRRRCCPPTSPPPPIIRQPQRLLFAKEVSSSSSSTTTSSTSSSSSSTSSKSAVEEDKKEKLLDASGVDSLENTTNSTSSTASSTNSSSSISIEEAETLRRRAKELLAEAREMELELSGAASRQKGSMDRSQSSLFGTLFKNNTITKDPAEVARVLRDDRWSDDQALAVLKGLHERRKSATTTISPAAVQPEGFVIGDVNNAATVSNETETTETDAYAECIFQAAAILDSESSNPSTKTNTRWSGRGESTLKSQWREMLRNDDKELEQRMLVLGLNPTNVSATNATVNEYMKRTLGMPVSSADGNSRQFNLTRVMERVAMTPGWLPTTLLPYLVATRDPVLSEDVKAIKERVLQGTPFFLTSSDSIPSAAVFRGNIRTDNTAAAVAVSSGEKNKDESIAADDRNQTAIVFEEIQKGMDREGLSDRLQLFMLSDPEWRPGLDDRETKPRPVLLALSKVVEPDDRVMEKKSRAKDLFRSASILLSIVFTFAYSVGCFALNPTFFNSIVNKYDAKALVACLPIFAGVVAIQAVHELAHTIAARRWKIKTGLPVPLPSAQLGTFGCIRPLRSFPATRAALLDFALSGPVAAFLLSLLCMVGGALRTVQASEVALAAFPFIPVAILKSSFLSGTVLTYLAPKTMMMPLSQPIPVSPLFMIGYSGLLSSAFNLLPIWRLDGGRAASAALGPRFGALASAATVFSLLSIATSTSASSGAVLGWLVLVVLFQRRPEIPARDEVTEVDDFRLWSWIASLLASIATLAPFPGGP